MLNASFSFGLFGRPPAAESSDILQAAKIAAGLAFCTRSLQRRHNLRYHYNHHTCSCKYLVLILGIRAALTTVLLQDCRCLQIMQLVIQRKESHKH
jgi:predicted component of type VI protein secretion system